MWKWGGVSRASILYHAAVMAASGLFLQVLGFFYRMLQSRLVGAEGMGWFSLVMPVYGIITSVSLSGICMAINHLSAEADALGDRKALPRIFRAGTAYFLLMFLVMAGVVLVFRWEIAENLLGKREVGNALLLFLPCIFLTGFENLCKSVCYGIGKVRTPVVSEIGEQVVRIAAVGGILVMTAPATPVEAVEAIILGMTVSEVFSSLYMTVSLTCIFAKMKQETGRFKRKIGRSVIALALPVSLSAIAGNLISSAITVSLPQRLIAGGMIREEAVAALGTVNAMATPLLSLPLAFVYPIGSAVAPRIASRLACGDARDAERKAQKAFEAAALIAFPTCLALYPVSGFLLREVFHGEIAENMLLLLTISAMLAAVQAVSTSVLTGYEKHRVAMVSNLMGSLLHFGVMWKLAADAQFGLTGYLVGCVLGNLLPAFVNVYWIRRRLGVRISRKRAFLRPLCMAIFSFLPERAVFQMLGESRFSAAAALAVALAVDVMLLFVWDYHPIAYLKTLIPKARRQAAAAKAGEACRP